MECGRYYLVEGLAPADGTLRFRYIVSNEFGSTLDEIENDLEQFPEWNGEPQVSHPGERPILDP